MKVWIVRQGEVDADGILAVFALEREATAYVDAAKTLNPHCPWMVWGYDIGWTFDADEA